MSAVTERVAAGRPALCGDRADPVQSCFRELGHDGPHRHPARGEWLNLSPAARVCDDRGATPHGVGRCTRDLGHEGAHADYKRNLYWQATS
jgi:hypothetical protein